MDQKILKLAQPSTVLRSNVNGFSYPDYNVEKYDGDELFAHIFIPFIKDSLDAIHVSRVLDPTYDRPSIQHLLATQARENKRRIKESVAFEATFKQYERNMAIYMTNWYTIQNEIEALPDSAQKDQRKIDHEAHEVQTRATNPEPIERAFVSILSSSDCSKIAAYLIQDNKDKDLAESALTLFKQKLGPRLSKEMLTIWNDPVIRCVDKARSTLDYIMMFQLSNPEITVAKLTNDMFSLLPATTVKGAVFLYDQMCFLQNALGRVDIKFVWPETLLLSTISLKLLGPAFHNLKFLHKQTVGHTKNVPRLASEFGNPLPKHGDSSAVTWEQLGTQLNQIAQPESDDSTTTVAHSATAVTQEEAQAWYMRSESQLGKRPFQATFSSSSSAVSPPWIQSSVKAFQPFVPRSNNPYGQYSQQYQQQQLQQQLQPARQTRPQLPFKPAGGAYAPRGPPVAYPPRLAVPQQTNVAKGSARPGLVPVHDKSTGKLSYYVQADATDDSAVAGEDSGPFMTFGATEDSAETFEDQAYYVGSDGVYHPYN